MQVADRFNESQPKTISRTVSTFLAPKEPSENTFSVRAFNSRPIVGNAQCRIGKAHVTRDRNHSSLRAMFDRVLNKVRQQLRQQIVITKHLKLFVRHLGGEFNTSILSSRLEDFRNIAYDLTQVVPREPFASVTPLNLSDTQKGVEGRYDFFGLIETGGNIVRADNRTIT